MVAQERINVRETLERKSNFKVSFFSMYFVWTNEKIFVDEQIIKCEWPYVSNCCSWRVVTPVKKKTLSQMAAPFLMTYG